jgi:hypothetical protein
MGNVGNTLSNTKEIMEWAKNGWNFRVKTTKGKKYITRRKGQKEKSLGPFKPETWAIINKTISDLEKRVPLLLNMKLIQSNM